MLQLDNNAKGKPLLHFHGNNEHIFNADSYIYLKNRGNILSHLHGNNGYTHHYRNTQ